ncbi:hypothetical protein [Aliikangiella sp. IMCC44359]|uniref:hypothetical protein n=1 Tax=Aliikangiella sp. IMCC44359 TaxID=3459125 RepID=UPI00403A88B2
MIHLNQNILFTMILTLLLIGNIDFAFSVEKPSDRLVNSRSEQFYPNSCPENFLPGQHAGLCLGPGVNKPASSDKLGSENCANSLHVPILGLSYCIQQGLHLAIEANKVLLTNPIGGDCIEGYRKISSMNTCFNKDVGLDIVAERLKLVSQIGSSREEIRASNKNDRNLYGCNNVFLWNKDNNFCVSRQIIENRDATRYGLMTPKKCGAYFTRENHNQLCEPIYKLHRCGELVGCTKLPGDTFVISTEPLNCGSGLKKTFTRIPTNLPPIATQAYDPKKTIIMAPIYVCSQPGKL